MSHDEGEVRQQFSIVFTALHVGGEARTGSASKRFGWFGPAADDSLPMQFRGGVTPIGCGASPIATPWA